MIKFTSRAASLRSFGLVGLMLASTLLWDAAASAQTANAVLIAQGKAVATAGDCAACHSSNGGQAYAGGRAIDSPMGKIYASNITPSKTDGIGNYTEQQFDDALRKGINGKGQHLYPAMPYTAYAGVSDADVHALYMYFMQGVRPIDHSVPKTQLAFPFSLRFSMAAWDMLYIKSGEYKNDPALSDKLNRGKYLVDTLGHCGSCHSPRGVLMAERSDAYLAGAVIDGWIAPNLTSDSVSGIGGWSEDELAQYLKDGHVKDKGQAGGGMAEAIENSLSQLPDDDLHAIAAYLKTVPAIHNPADSKPSYTYSGGEALPDLTTLEPQQDSKSPDLLKDLSTTQGAELYQAACASCHQPDGHGTDGQYFPSLSHNRAVGLSEPNNLVMAIVKGVDRRGADQHVFMPPFGADLNDAQIAAVATYVSQHFGNPALRIDAKQVTEIRAGGPVPLLIKLMPWLLGFGGLVVLVALILLLRLLRRR